MTKLRSFFITIYSVAALESANFAAGYSGGSMPRREAMQKSAAATSLLLGPTWNAEKAIASTKKATTPPVQIDDKGKATLPPLGLGAWAWGDSLFWGYSPKEDAELAQVFDYAVENGVGFFDTAELYGIGRSESLIKNFRASWDENEQRVSVATKFAALPWRTRRSDVVAAAKASVKRLGRPIDLYQIHFPNAYANEQYWDGLGDAFEAGLVKSVGVSNYGSAALRACHSKLAERGIPLSSNQIQLSLLYRCPLENGLKATCDELGVSTIAYSPLGLGLLTGKYDATHFPTGPRGKLAEQLFGKNPSASEKLFGTMREIASSHVTKDNEKATLSQVALNWAIFKGTTVIPGARTLKQVKQNLGALDWELSKAEVEALDAAAAPLPPLVPPEKAPFPKQDKDTGLVMFDS